MKYLKRILDESTEIRVKNYLTERFIGKYKYDEYILNIAELVLYKEGIEVFRIKLNEISDVCGSTIEI